MTAPNETVEKWSERFAVECWNRLFPGKVFPRGTLGDATMREMGPIVLAIVGPPPSDTSAMRCTCGSGAHPRPCMLHPHGFAQHILDLNAETIEADAYERAAKECEEHAAGADDGESDGVALAARIRALSPVIGEPAALVWTDAQMIAVIKDTQRDAREVNGNWSELDSPFAILDRARGGR